MNAGTVRDHLLAHYCASCEVNWFFLTHPVFINGVRAFHLEQIVRHGDVIAVGGSYAG